MQQLNEAASPATGEADDDYFARVKRMFEEARDSTQEARRESDIDDAYFHADQWTAAERKELARRKQPVINYNLIRTKVESICGVEENSRTSPQAWPRTPADEGAAHVATDTLRYACDLNRFDKTRIDVLRDMLVRGTGGAIVEVKPKGGQAAGTLPNALLDATALTPAPLRYEIIIRKLRFEYIVYDPFSREADFSDARYLGGVLWMDEGDVIATYGEAARGPVEAAIGEAGLQRGGAMDSYSDRPNHTWADPKRRRVMVVELYHREGGAWRHCVFTGGGMILKGPSAYLDADGVPACPIELASTYINGQNERYGIVRDMRSPQDEIKGTKYGIAAASYPHIDIKGLTLSQAAAIYRRDYWDAIGGDALPAGVDLAVFDPAIHSGVARARTWYAAARGAEPAGTVRRICDARRAFLAGLSTFRIYGKGWLARVAKVEATGVRWALEAAGATAAAVKGELEVQARRAAAEAEAAVARAKRAAAATGASDAAAASIDTGLHAAALVLAMAALAIIGGIVVLAHVHRMRTRRESAQAFATEAASLSSSLRPWRPS